MKVVNVNASENYNVYIEKGILDRVGEFAAEISKGRVAAIISDSNVAPLYAESVTKSLRKSGFETHLFVIPAGEQEKTPENLVAAAEYLLDKGLTRSDLVVSLGGGVITDMAGLCAALYQRGVKVLQIPTSLLAMVDASTGGKTAVNLSRGKNMFGTFYQPSAVLCDSSVLSTLPKEEFSNGMAEVIKYAVLRSGKLLDLISQDNILLLLDEIIEECISIKRDYVCADEFDRGDRQFLNLGHTVGHAIERTSNFSVPHGSAVSAGLCIMARACQKLGICSLDTVNIIENLCRKFSLPTDTTLSSDTLYDASLSDKKRQGREISMIMIKAMGECYLHSTHTEFLSEIIKKGAGE